MTLAVILNAPQAQRLIEAGHQAIPVLSFCPSASYQLRGKGYHVTDTSDIYKVPSHARATLATHRDFSRVTDAAAAQYGLDYAETENLRCFMHQYLCCAYHYHYCLRGLHAQHIDYLWVESEKLKSGDYAALFASLCRQSATGIMTYASHPYMQPHRLLALLYNRIIAFFIRRSGRMVIINYGDSLPDRIVQAAREAGENPIHIHTYKLRQSLKTTGFFFRSLYRLYTKDSARPVYQFRAPTRWVRGVAAFDAPEIAVPEVAQAVRDVVRRYVPFVRKEVLAGYAIVKHTRPHLAVSDHATYPFVVAGLEEVGKQRGMHAMLNHSTHTIQHAPISSLAADIWAWQQRVINRNTTDSLPKSPLTQALVERVRPEGGYKITKVNVYERYGREQSMDGPFVLLHAGNFTNAFDHIPWCKETGHEYLLGMIELMEEVAKLDNVELIFKLKNKKTGNYKAILEEHIARLGVADKVQVATVGFTQHVKRAHMVVCNLSATIEQALSNQLPVLLHSYRKNYFHIDEKIVAESTIDGLAPAYLVKERADIARIVTALSARRAELRNPALFAKVAWQEKDLTSMVDFAKDLIERKGR